MYQFKNFSEPRDPAYIMIMQVCNKGIVVKQVYQRIGNRDDRICYEKDWITELKEWADKVEENYSIPYAGYEVALSVDVPKNFVVGNFEKPKHPAQYTGVIEPKKVNLGIIKPK